MSHTGVAIGTSPWLKSMATAETMPITRPRVSITGPPLLPPCSEASIWNMFSKARRTLPRTTLALTVSSWVRLPSGKPSAITRLSLGSLPGSISRSSGRGTRPSGMRSILITATSSLSGDLNSWRVRTGGLATPAISTLGEPSVL